MNVDPKLATLLKTANGYIFDMDGTIVDLEELNYVSMEKALATIDVPLTHELYSKNMAGVTIRVGFENILNELDIGVPISELIAEFWRFKRSILRTDLKSVVTLKTGVAEFIKKAKESGKSLAIATSAKREFMELILTSFELLQYFDTTVTADDIQKSKPDPEIFLKTQTALNLPKSDCVIFEDSKSGIMGAKASGMTCIGIRTNRWNKAHVELADYVIDDYTGLSTQL